MGCASSSPDAAAAVTPAKPAAKPAPPANKPPPAPAAAGKNGERQATADTEASLAAPLAGALVGAAPSSPRDSDANDGVPPKNDGPYDHAAALKTFRLASSGSCAVGKLSVRYACLSRRGRDPDQPSKPNQDCYGAHPPDEFDGSSAAAFFAVYDGHGPRGEGCSHLVRTRLPGLIRDEIEKRGGVDWASVDDVHDALRDAHLEVNRQLRRSDVDDSYSGTTSVGVYLHDDRITVCNVGDSRVVLGTASDNETRYPSGIQAVPLSKDHTPRRPDEAARCRAAGARILSFGEIDPSTREDDDDDVEDPPRVWARRGNYPGTAFTRSVGDSVAEALGVHAEPETVTLPISDKERLLVLASDGVYDVMSNQDVVDVCYKHRGDPAGACAALIERSHEEWLLNDDCGEDEANYDDMTCVVVFFDRGGQEGAVDAGGGGDPEEERPKRQGKRVRQKTLQNLEEMGK